MMPLVMMLLAQADEPATLDFRGLLAERATLTLTNALPDLEACLVAAPERKPGKPFVRERLPSEHLLTLMVDRSGAVAAAKVEGQHSVRLEPKCAERVLIRLEFGECAVTTKVKAPLRCGEKTCSFPWSPAPK
jgi:hypothetical protein